MLAEQGGHLVRTEQLAPYARSAAIDLQLRWAFYLAFLRGQHDGIVVGTDLVNEPYLHRLPAGEDPPVRELEDFLAVHVASLGHRIHKLVVDVLHQALQQLLLVSSHRPEGRANVFVVARLDGGVLDTDLLHEAVVGDGGHDDTDAAGHRSAICQDLVGGAGDIQAARGSYIIHRRDDGFLLRQREDFLVYALRCCGRSSGAVDVEHDGLYALIPFGSAQVRHDRPRPRRATE